MCNRYQLKIDFDALANELAAYVPCSRIDSEIVPGASSWTGSYNIKPTNDVPVVRLLDSKVRVELLHWGWRPPKRPDAPVVPGPKKPDEYFNVRSETIQKFGSGAYGKRQSCLIPATGFWEWGPDKQPRCIQPRDGGLMCFAGIYLPTFTKAGEETTGCVIATTDPNQVMAPIHTRMPVILPPELWEAWLTAPSREILKPADDDLLHLWQVAKFGTHDHGPDLLRPVVPPEPLPTLSLDL